MPPTQGNFTPNIVTAEPIIKNPRHNEQSQKTFITFEVVKEHPIQGALIPKSVHAEQVTEHPQGDLKFYLV